MKRLVLAVLMMSLFGCSSNEQPGAGDKVLVEQTVSATAGALVFYDGDPSIVLSLPPTAVASDVAVTITRVDDDVDDTLSPVIAVAPESMTLRSPGSLSIAVQTPVSNLVLARVTEHGLETLPGSGLDPVTQEVRGEIDRFGRFVVVAGNASMPANPPQTADASTTPSTTQSTTAAATAATSAQSTGMFSTAPAVPQAEAPASLPLEGQWNGVAPHDAFEIEFGKSSFEVSRDGTTIRSGTYVLNGTSLALIDHSGVVEVASVAFAGNELTLDSAESGTVRWSRVASADSSRGGFFALDDKGQTTPPRASTEQPAAAKPKSSAPSSAPRPSTPALAEQAPPTKKKNLFERLGSGVANVGRNVVSGVKNIGKSSAQEAEAIVTGEVAAVGTCAVLAPVAAVAIGADQRPPTQLDNGCEIRGKQKGRVGFSVDPSGTSSAMADLRRSGQCTAAPGVGDEACLVNLGGSRAKLVFRKGTMVGTVDVDTPGGDAVFATTQIAQLVAAQF